MFLNMGENKPISERQPTVDAEKCDGIERVELETRYPSDSRAGNPPASASSVRSGVECGAGDEEEKRPPGLPFSKARCIALVATVTGASFLNV